MNWSFGVSLMVPMSLLLARNLGRAKYQQRVSTVRPSCQQRTFGSSLVQLSKGHDDHGHDHAHDHGHDEHGHGHADPSAINAENGANARCEEMRKPLPADLKELDKRFDDIFQISPEDEDRGVERHERLTRIHMKRQPHFQGDFSSLEEHHILFGDRGTPTNPIIIESIYPVRIVGCTGSHETQTHELLWHNVKREKPLVCLECGQVFQLQTPAGEKIYDLHADGH